MTQRLLLLFFLILSLCSCRNKAADDRPTLTVSIEPLRYVVEQVAGERFRVVTLMPQGASPETYEPTPRQMMELNDSRALMRVGSLGFEHTKLPQMAANAAHLPLIDLGRGITHVTCTQHSHDGSLHSADPHSWMSAASLQVMAENVCRSLSLIDSLHRDEYEKRLVAFKQKMEQLDRELRQRMQGLQQRAFLIYHPSLGYFARDYGLVQYAVEQDGKEPSAAYLHQLTARCRAEGVKTVFISKEHTGRAAQRVAEQLGTKPVIINPLDYDVPAQLLLIASHLEK